MDKYVELFKSYEALYVSKIKGSYEGLSLMKLGTIISDLQYNGITDVDFSGSLTFGKFKLVLSHCSAPFGWPWESDQELKETVDNNLELAFYREIKKIGDYLYGLNISPIDWYCDGSNAHKYGGSNKPTGSECPPKLLNKHFSLYMPIIQKFMVDALTDNLYIIEDGKLVKQ